LLILSRQLNVDFPLGSDKDLAERIAGRGQLSQFTTEMDESAKEMLLYFKNQPPKGNVHIIVEKPVIGTCFLCHLGSRTDGVVSWHPSILLLPLFFGCFAVSLKRFRTPSPDGNQGNQRPPRTW
jgi:hypothetical protein